MTSGNIAPIAEETATAKGGNEETTAGEANETVYLSSDHAKRLEIFQSLLPVDGYTVDWDSVVQFLQEYPNSIDNPNSNANLRFYSNQIRMAKTNATIDQLLGRVRINIEHLNQAEESFLK
jgi:hypothetical protein